MDRFYRILGLPSNATKTEVKKAYRKLAMKYHPDRNPSPDAAQKFQQITLAYDIILSGKSTIQQVIVKTRKQSPEEKWKHVHHPPSDPAEFKEWFDYKKANAKRRTDFSFEEFLGELNKEEKKRYRRNIYLFLIVPVVAIGSIPFTMRYDEDMEKLVATELSTISMIVGFIAIAVASGIMMYYDKRLKRLYKEEEYYRRSKRRRKKRK